ncbi:DNA cytosine methyltransferase [Paenibacillus sp. Y412MC10]|uniref:DNA cytosine methyltransferase n=1 Tax=Geobacillus sp. (strain Y412MC10) TaxID=481743 RepID=UPI0011AB5546|nr:DNA (cytosine-5-)-methyltransferase [Paenibacillus sp. Y412MC10]
MPDVYGNFTCSSFFSGGGFLDYAFKDFFSIIWANEMCEPAAESYAANIGSHIRVGDITQIPMYEIPGTDLIIGGPPCQEYSSSGTNKGEKGDRGKLVWTYLRVIKEKKPMAFLFENVVGLARKHKTTLTRLIAQFEKMGYTISWKIVNSSRFGTPQHRERVIIVGIRNDLGFAFKFPDEAAEERTVRMAISDLPTADGTFPNHYSTWSSPTPERIYDVIANPRNQFRGMRRLPWDGISPTLTAHIAKDGREFLHPHEDRRLTVRECLRIMSVPDSYVFPESVPLSHQYRAIGNGVEFNMGRALAIALKQQLCEVPTQICLF